MIIGIGLDIVEVERLKDKENDTAFLAKIYTEKEKEYILKKACPSIYLASHFAAKEAILKAIGSGMGYGFSTLDFEILHDDKGKPFYKLSKKILDYFGGKNITSHLTITHEKHYALACAILELLD